MEWVALNGWQLGKELFWETGREVAGAPVKSHAPVSCLGIRLVRCMAFEDLEGNACLLQALRNEKTAGTCVKLAPIDEISGC